MQELVKKKEVDASALIENTLAFDIGKEEALTLFAEILLLG